MTMPSSDTRQSAGAALQHERDRYWQRRWEEAGVFVWRNDASRPKYYCLEMFPYTSGRMHLGHARNYAMGDALARMQRALGFDVLYPMGWDAFGLPAETAAIKSGKHPAEFTRSSIENMKRAMQSLGLSYSWPNEISTCEPDYMAAQQRLFIEFFNAGLIYRDTSFVFWCDSHQTILAAEQAANGVCWRCGEPVTKRRQAQWFFNIRTYADRLLDGLDRLEGWPASVLNIQREWIGRSWGVEADFSLQGAEGEIRVFTTRADTLAGCTFLAVAPEHPLIDRLPLADAQRRTVEAFRNDVLMQSADERAKASKVGVDTGLAAINPLTDEAVPIYVANYVLSDYGTGAIMAVPAHDERDFEFAQAKGLPIRRVITEDPAGADVPLTQAYVGEGVIVNSGPLNGLSTHDGADRVAEILRQKGKGRKTKSVRLQNWSISRQRLWGNPIPIVYCNKCGALPVKEADLPVLLPTEIPSDGEGSPLSRLPSFWRTKCEGCGGEATRDTDTMDTFVDSSWYFMRFPTPTGQRPVNSEVVNRMLPVDVYVGGVEHATLHLIYARFFTMVLKDFGYCNFDEPFTRVFNQGMVNDQLGRKQSKSLGNIVEPDDVIREHGADALRMFLLFKTTHNAPINWDDSGPEAAVRYLDRVERLAGRFAEALAAHPDSLEPALTDSVRPAQRQLCHRTHTTIEKVTRDIERFQFNTAIASLMELTNELYLYDQGGDTHDRVAAGAFRTLIRLLNPFAPHRTEEMWAAIQGTRMLAASPWPELDRAAIESGGVSLVVQVNGKFVAEITHDRSANEEEIARLVLAREDVARRVGERQIKRQIYAPGRILNILV